MSFNILFSQLYLIRHSGVTWVAGDEQTVFLPGARHFQCPLPSELLWLETSRSSSCRGAQHFQCQLPSELLLSVWRQFCTARLLVCISCVCFVSLSVYFCFPLPPNMGQKLTTPLKFDSRTLEISQRPSQQPIGRSKKRN